MVGVLAVVVFVGFRKSLASGDLVNEVTAGL
jgi:hypothetical protein